MRDATAFDPNRSAGANDARSPAGPATGLDTPIDLVSADGPTTAQPSDLAANRHAAVNTVDAAQAAADTVALDAPSAAPQVEESSREETAGADAKPVAVEPSAPAQVLAGVASHASAATPVEPSAPIVPTLSAADLVRLGRDIPVPFDVALDTPDGRRALHCEALLRVLPSRRIVVRGRIEDRAVAAKLFVGARAQVERQWEERGRDAFVRAGVATPELVARGEIDGGGEALVYEFLDDARPANESDLPHMMPILAQLHAHGVVQNDLHLGNVLRTTRGLYLIDGGAVSGMGRDRPLSRRASVRNVALFLAQFGIRAEAGFVGAWHAYAVARGFKTIDAAGTALITAVHRARRARVRDYLKKVLRECSEFCAEQRFDRKLVCDRASFEGDLRAFVEDVEARFDEGTVVKAGNTATVARFRVGDANLVVKRYNIKSWRHAFGRAWRPTRAQRSWQNAHRLRLLGIPTFKPVALVERRFGPLRGAGYLVMRALDGVDLKERLESRHIPALVALFADLSRAGIVHGDTKATNFVDVNGTIHLLDLDAMRAPRTRWGLRRGAARDVARFIANWRDSATIRAALSRAFGVAVPGAARTRAATPPPAAASRK